MGTAAPPSKFIETTEEVIERYLDLASKNKITSVVRFPQFIAPCRRFKAIHDDIGDTKRFSAHADQRDATGEPYFPFGKQDRRCNYTK